jgi:hypothetical protein
MLGVRGSTFLLVFVGVGVLTVLPAVLFSGPCIFVGASAGVVGLLGYTYAGFGRKFGEYAPSAFLVFVLALSFMAEASAAGVAIHVFALILGVGLAFVRGLFGPSVRQ